MHQVYFSNWAEREKRNFQSSIREMSKSVRSSGMLLTPHHGSGSVFKSLFHDYSQYRINRDIDQYQKNINWCDTQLYSLQDIDGSGTIITTELEQIDQKFGAMVTRFVVREKELAPADILTRRITYEVLVTLLNKYAQNSSEHLHKNIQLLQESLQEFAGSWGYSSMRFFGRWPEVWFSRISVFDQQDIVEYFVRRFRALIGRIKLVFRSQDLRYHFRTLVKFLFKNMDDESDAMLITAHYAVIQYVPSNSLQNEQFRDNKTFSRAARKTQWSPY